MIYSAKNHRTVYRAELYTWLWTKNYAILQINRELGEGMVKYFPDLMSATEVKKGNLDIYERVIKN